MKTVLINLNVQELSRSEIISINGGGPTWRWLGKILGYVNEIGEGLDTALKSPEGVACMQALRDFQ